MSQMVMNTLYRLLIKTDKQVSPERTSDERKSKSSSGDDVFADEKSENNEMFTGVAEVSINKALNSEEKEAWERAIQAEVSRLIKNDTFEIVKYKIGQNVVGSRFVLTKKYRPDGSIVARLQMIRIC